MTYVRYTCDRCGQQKESDHVWIERTDAIYGLPPGWIQINNKLYCPKHLVEVKIEDKSP